MWRKSAFRAFLSVSIQRLPYFLAFDLTWLKATHSFSLLMVEEEKFVCASLFHARPGGQEKKEETGGQKVIKNVKNRV
jgi:hypothetical protein